MSIQARIDEARQRIEETKPREIRQAMKYQYLSGTRISEVLGKYAIQSDELTLTKYKEKNLALFLQKTAKKKGSPRAIALPIESDQWIPEIIELFQSKKGQIFKMSDQTLENYAKKTFEGITYKVQDYQAPIEAAIEVEEGELILGLEYEKVEEHQKEAVTHYLRKLRESYMTFIKGFTEMEKYIFFGWVEKGMGSRYSLDTLLQWPTYIDKLL